MRFVQGILRGSALVVSLTGTASKFANAPEGVGNAPIATGAAAEAAAPAGTWLVATGPAAASSVATDAAVSEGVGMVRDLRGLSLQGLPAWWLQGTPGCSRSAVLPLRKAPAACCAAARVFWRSYAAHPDGSSGLIPANQIYHFAAAYYQAVQTHGPSHTIPRSPLLYPSNYRSSASGPPSFTVVHGKMEQQASNLTASTFTWSPAPVRTCDLENFLARNMHACTHWSKSEGERTEGGVVVRHVAVMRVVERRATEGAHRAVLCVGQPLHAVCDEQLVDLVAQAAHVKLPCTSPSCHADCACAIYPSPGGGQSHGCHGRGAGTPCCC